MSNESYTGRRGIKRFIELFLRRIDEKQELLEELDMTKQELEEMLKGGEEDMDLITIEQKLDEIENLINETKNGITTELSAITVLLQELNEKECEYCASNEARFDALDATLAKLSQDLADATEDITNMPEPTDFIYALDKDNRTITLQRYNGADSIVVIAAKYKVNGKSYRTRIGDNQSSGSSDTKGLFSGNTAITSVSFDDVKFISCYYLFKGCTSLTEVTWDRSGDMADMTECASMAYMFSGCTALSTVDLSICNIAGVTDMNHMFDGFTGSAIVFGDSIDTSMVTNMSYMFNKCTNVNTLDLDNVDTAAVTNMSYMFSECSNLSNIKFAKVNTAKVTNMSYMFNKCTVLSNGLSSILAKFNTAKVINMSSMFYSCKALTELSLTSFDTSLVTNMGSMFNYCEALITLDLTSFDTKKVTSMTMMFYYCSKLTQVKVTSGKWVEASSKDGMWTKAGCNSVTYV